MRKLIGACGAAFILMLPACASPVVGVGAPVGANSGASTSGSVTYPETAALPADQIVFQVTNGSGYVPEVTAALVSPALTIYGDGRVYAMEPDSWSTPPVLSIGSVDPTLVSQFVFRTESLDVFDESTDFGSPGVTDMGTTTVTVHGESGEKTVDVYALGSGFDEGLSGSEVEARDNLTAVISEAFELAAELTETTPESLRAWDLGAAEGSDAGLPEWTGPALAEFSPSGVSSRQCVEITDGVQKLYEAALTNEDAIWQTTEGARVIAVTPLLPGQSPCER